MSLDFELAKTRGISAPSAVGFMPFEERNGKIVLKDVDRAQLAQDAALSTQPNVGAPAALYTYVDPRIIDVLFGVTNATRFFEKTLVGKWTDDFATFKVSEIAGHVSPYNDFADGTEHGQCRTAGGQRREVFGRRCAELGGHTLSERR